MLTYVKCVYYFSEITYKLLRKKVTELRKPDLALPTSSQGTMNKFLMSLSLRLLICNICVWKKKKKSCSGWNNTIVFEEGLKKKKCWELRNECRMRNLLTLIPSPAKWDLQFGGKIREEGTGMKLKVIVRGMYIP